MTQTLANVMIAGMPHDIKATPEQIEILKAVNAKGFDAQCQAWNNPAGRRTRECPKCGEEFTCEYTFAAFDGMIGAPLWHQSCCNPCLYNRGKNKTQKMKERQVTQYADFDIAKLPPAAAKIAPDFLDWTPQQGVGFGLIGLQDTGKSYLLHALGRKLEDAGRVIAVVNDRDINRMVTPDGNKDRLKTLSVSSRADVILWDDFGTFKMTDSVEEFLNKILDFAYQSKTPILASSNFSGDQLKDRWTAQMGETSWQGVRGDKILKRLKNRCRMYAV